MKRGISLVTSLMMTASVVGGAVSQAFVTSPVTVVSAAAVQPTIGIGKTDFAGTTTVAYGVKKVSVPVIVNATDLAAMKVRVVVTSNTEGEADPVITGIRQAGIPVITEGAPKGNERFFLWNSDMTDGETIVVPTLNQEVIAYVDIELPYDNVTSINSTYTVEIDAEKLDGSDVAETEGYSFNIAESDLKEVIAFNSNIDESYELDFSSKGADDKWHIVNSGKLAVKPGAVVPVGLEITCPAVELGAMKYTFAVDNGAKIVGFDTSETGLNESYFDVSEKNPIVIWTEQEDGKGVVVKEQTHFITVNVQIPEDASAGDVFNLSLINPDTSTSQQIDIMPVETPSIDLVVESEVEFRIASKTVKAGTEMVELPVYIKNGEVAAVLAKFEATNGAKIVSITKGKDVAGEVTPSEKIAKVIWNNTIGDDFKDEKFGATESEMFVLTVELPKDSDAKEFDIKFAEGLDVVNADQLNLVPKTKDGKITIASYEAKMTIKDTDDVKLEKETTVSVPVKMTASALQSVAGKFTVTVEGNKVSVDFVDGDAACVFDKEAVEAALEVAFDDATFNVITGENVTGFTAEIVGIENTAGGDSKLSVSDNWNIVWSATESGTVLGADFDDADFANVQIKLVPEMKDIVTTVSETTVSETTVSETTVSETTVSETTVSETTVSETTVSETTVSETTVSETTVSETTVSETTVSETTITTSEPVVTTEPKVTLPDIKDPIVVKPADDDWNKEIIPEDYEAEFYYSHEDSFYKLNDDFSATVKVEKKTLNEDKTEYKTETVDVKLTKDNFKFPTDISPESVYTGKTFIYTVPVTLDVTNVDAAADIKAALEKEKITVDLPVYIGQLGDVNLNHKVEQIDGTYILRDILALDMKQDSVIESVVKKNTAAVAEVNDRAYEFAKFLGDVNNNGSVAQNDATYILRACLARDMGSSEKTDRISEEIWKSLGLLK
ncbi:MAG: hypothetical protein E7505_04770 [Ruminococcus sp.]|nr:hypothetical protein [Ruminococcus sp.]